jgi:CheY-like chemotaxis protein
MPNGGQLTLSTKNVSLFADAEPTYPEAITGPHVVVSVADTGKGIPPEIFPRIFEPFFTTKTHDKGTGLGLSTVVEIIKRHKGFIQVQSEVGKGTEFKLYLPAVSPTPMDEAKPKATPTVMGNGELILIVDDELAVIEMAKTALESYGYRTLTALNGLEALTCFQANQSEISVLLTDTDMPFLNGMNMIRKMQKLKPKIPIIIASGGKRDSGKLWLIDTTRLITLNKPYDVEQLLDGVTKALNVSVKE